MDCYICLESCPNVPLLKCGHFVCPPCYCDLKSRRFYHCSLCRKELVRGKKKQFKILIFRKFKYLFLSHFLQYILKLLKDILIYNYE